MAEQRPGVAWRSLRDAASASRKRSARTVSRVRAPVTSRVTDRRRGDSVFFRRSSIGINGQRPFACFFFAGLRLWAAPASESSRRRASRGSRARAPLASRCIDRAARSLPRSRAVRRAAPNRVVISLTRSSRRVGSHAAVNKWTTPLSVPATSSCGSRFASSALCARKNASASARVASVSGRTGSGWSRADRAPDRAGPRARRGSPSDRAAHASAAISPSADRGVFSVRELGDRAGRRRSGLPSIAICSVGSRIASGMSRQCAARGGRLLDELGIAAAPRGRHHDVDRARPSVSKSSLSFGTRPSFCAPGPNVIAIPGLELRALIVGDEPLERRRQARARPRRVNRSPLVNSFGTSDSASMSGSFVRRRHRETRAAARSRRGRDVAEHARAARSASAAATPRRAARSPAARCSGRGSSRARRRSASPSAGSVFAGSASVPVGASSSVHASARLPSWSNATHTGTIHGFVAVRGCARPPERSGVARARASAPPRARQRRRDLGLARLIEERRERGREVLARGLADRGDEVAPRSRCRTRAPASSRARRAANTSGADVALEHVEDRARPCRT